MEPNTATRALRGTPSCVQKVFNLPPLDNYTEDTDATSLTGSDIPTFVKDNLLALLSQSSSCIP